MKELPKVYVNSFDREINNSQSFIVVDEREIINYDDILTKDKYSFNHTYIINLKNDKEVIDSIIQITDNKILTINNSWIDKSDIKSIKENKK